MDMLSKIGLLVTTFVTSAVVIAIAYVVSKALMG
jgi:hypothetical protein